MRGMSKHLGLPPLEGEGLGGGSADIGSRTCTSAARARYQPIEQPALSEGDAFRQTKRQDGLKATHSGIERDKIAKHTTDITF
jgi:hypothetical protein